MNDSTNQFIDRLKTANNILVTVSANPSVDQLSACIAMTLLLGKFKKNATAVFSGKVPSVLEFLHPEQTIQASTDSLRDFIIAIDKSKADKLRYKLEEDVVKIFITPYKTSITPDDLHYSAGDFNVDLIVALGVQHQQDLDTAITAHGRIFHDAVTVTMNNQPGGDLGVVNWEDFEASSLSEMVATLLSSLDATLLDADIATALLTGIVAETSRFSNDKTHPGTLTVSSALLAAGADQQLVNSKLQDLIGIVVNLKAGDQIAPTVSGPQISHEVAEELVVGKDGSLQEMVDDGKPEGIASLPEADVEKAIDPVAPIVVEPPVDSAETPAVTQLGLPASQVSQLEPQDDLAVARQALLDAHDDTEPTPLNAPQPEQGMVTDQTPQMQYEPALAPAVQPIAPETIAPAMSPLITSIPANQPSYASPATTTVYDQPAMPTPANEQAPLSMSPADQAMTMPLPPSSAAAGESRPVFPPPAQPAVSTIAPPPLPPPIMPMQ